MNQDDPKKCTSLKLVRLGLLKKIQIRHIRRNAIVLNPMSADILSKNDVKYLHHGLVVIDCSWKQSSNVFTKQFPGKNKRLPLLQAGNPTNYSKLFTLSSSEAIAAALFIVGRYDESKLILSKFKWGHTFFELNSEILNLYSSAHSTEELSLVEKEYYKKFL